MSVELATLILSVVVVLATALGNAIGSAINNRRYSEIRLELVKANASLDKRVSLLERLFVTLQNPRRGHFGTNVDDNPL